MYVIIIIIIYNNIAELSRNICSCHKHKFKNSFIHKESKIILKNHSCV